MSCATTSLTVSFVRPEIAEEAGLDFATVAEQPISRTLECNAVVNYDGNRHARLSPQVPGLIASIGSSNGD